MNSDTAIQLCDTFKHEVSILEFLSLPYPVCDNFQRPRLSLSQYLVKTTAGLHVATLPCVTVAELYKGGDSDWGLQANY